ncbi:MAG: hypothetical protein MUF58_23325, partial [Arcicella sp.]|nr:hypothetical protein [Arcicella sp.]
MLIVLSRKANWTQIQLAFLLTADNQGTFFAVTTTLIILKLKHTTMKIFPPEDYSWVSHLV